MKVDGCCRAFDAARAHRVYSGRRTLKWGSKSQDYAIRIGAAVALAGGVQAGSPVIYRFIVPRTTVHRAENLENIKDHPMMCSCQMT